MTSFTVISTYSLLEPVLKNRIEPFVLLLLESGYTVNLICPAGGSLDTKGAGGFTHVQVDYPARGEGGFFKRALYEMMLSIKLFWVAKDFRSVYSLVTVPSMFLLFFYYKMSPNNILDIRDLTWEYFDDRKLIMSIAKKMFSLMARVKVKKFDLILVTNNSELEYVKTKLCVPPRQIVMVPNGISRRQFEALCPQDISHNKVLPLRVCYLGNVGLAQNLSILLQAAKKIPDVHFYIVGNGTDFHRVQQEAKDMMLSNVFFTGRISWDKIPELYSQSHILYSQLSSSFSSAMPSKLYEYLATGKFIIYGGEGQAQEILSSFQHNAVVTPDNPEALVAAINKIALNGLWENISVSNRLIIEKNYIRESSVRLFLSKIEGMINE